MSGTGGSVATWKSGLTIANVLRYNVIEKLNLGEFQLSQSYLFFYDKLEKANYYLEWVFTLVSAAGMTLTRRNVLDTLDEDLDSRLITYLNDAPVNDGGQWDMAVNLLGACERTTDLRTLTGRKVRCDPANAVPRVLLVRQLGPPWLDAHDQAPRVQSPPPRQPGSGSPAQGAVPGRGIQHPVHHPGHAAQARREDHLGVLRQGQQVPLLVWDAQGVLCPVWQAQEHGPEG